MEILPSIRTQYSRTLPSRNPSFFIANSYRKSLFFNEEVNPISWSYSSSHQIKGRKLVSSVGYNEGGPIAQRDLDNLPLSMELIPISSESQFDRVVAESQQLQEPIVILWMASWCRKCIYLKPKLQKLAADYYPRIKFFSVDVNSVSHKLVVRAEVTKMPTVQVWRDGKKQAEVVGGHKAYLVVNEVREMIENEDSL